MSNAQNQAPAMAAQPASFHGHPPRRPHILRWVLLLVVLIVAGWLIKRWFFSPAPPARAVPPVPVSTARAEVQTVPITRTGVGNVLPVMSVTVHTRVDGQLDSVAFREGQDVRAGQLLARIDPRTYQAQYDQSVAQKAKDDAQLANARVDLARYQDLIKSDATTRQTLDTQRALVSQLQATVKNDQAQIEYARVNLGYTTISAPISGRVGARLVDPGNIVHAADTTGLLVINQIDPIAVQFTLPEESFQAVNTALREGGGKAGALEVQAFDRATHEALATGHLVLLNNQIDTTTGTIMLKAQFPNAQHKLWPGQMVDARIVLGQREQALTVPSAAVQRSQDGLFTFVVDASSGTVRVQPITVADSDDKRAVITQGLQAGDRVVTDGQYRLTPGAHVAEAPAAAASATAGARPASAVASAASAIPAEASSASSAASPAASGQERAQ